MFFYLFSNPLKFITYLFFIFFINLNVRIFTHLRPLPFVSSLSFRAHRIPPLIGQESLKSHILLESLTSQNFLEPNTIYNAFDSNNDKLANGIYKWNLRSNTLAFIRSKCEHESNPAYRYRIYSDILMPGEDDHKMLKDLYLNRETIFDDSLGKKCNLYRYFNITKDNIKEHLDSTMEEFFENRRKKSEKSVYVIDGNAFNGEYDCELPLPRSMTSYKIPELGTDPIVPMGSQETNIEPKFDNEVLNSIYQMIKPQNDNNGVNDEDGKNSKIVKEEEDLAELYDEVGDNDYEIFDDHKLYTREFFQDLKIRSDEETKRDRELLHRVMIQPTAFPSYIDPENPVHRTGRRREIQRKRDSGRLQRLRWKMDVDSKDDIVRGEWDKGDDITKEFNDSIEWEQLMPKHQDNNYFKRNYYEGGFGDEDRTVDSFFDVQFIGSTDAYPFAVSAGMQFTWPIYWVPWLCKKNPKMRGQPIRSQVFNLGGVEPLQLWFYPEGSANSLDGYCSLKLVSPPGWNLPYRIYMYIFSEYNRVVLGPMYRESSEYVTHSINTCKLISKNKEIVKNAENYKDYVILGPSGNVYVGVGVVDEPVRKREKGGKKFEFKYDWDEGDYDFNQWLKKQTSDPDDPFTMKTIEKDRTHSIWYESHKYRHVPDRHISRYWKTRYKEDVLWNPPDFS
uniref:Uncharacterized protein n=1 Tax=Theileria annulata TaxID=5874 RepID=A0A3B0N428_THEAN